jgi:flavin-binding protein dodecin
MTVVKIIELVGSSKKNWEDAVQEAIDKAKKTIRNIRGIDVVGWKARVEDGKIIEYRANVKISFLVE